VAIKYTTLNEKLKNDGKMKSTQKFVLNKYLSNMMKNYNDKAKKNYEFISEIRLL
jgi:hypothetical protein